MAKTQEPYFKLVELTKSICCFSGYQPIRKKSNIVSHFTLHILQIGNNFWNAPGKPDHIYYEWTEL